MIDDRTRTDDERPIGSTYFIGEVSSLTGLTPRTLRHYDDLGVIRPAARSTGHFRVYSEEQLELCKVIAALRPLGLELSLIRTLVAALADPSPGIEQDAAGVLSALEQRQDRAAAQIAEAQHTIAGLRRALADAPTPDGDGPTAAELVGTD